jgi:hypothetical protein
MVQNQQSFAQAVKELKLPLEGYECDVLQKRADFKKILRQEKYAHHTEVAATPGRSKANILGMMQIAIDNLMAEGEWDKAISAMEKMAKLENYVGPDSVNIIAGLTARDIAEAREKLQNKINGTPEQPTNSKYTN